MKIVLCSPKKTGWVPSLSSVTTRRQTRVSDGWLRRKEVLEHNHFKNRYLVNYINGLE